MTGLPRGLQPLARTILVYVLSGATALRASQGRMGGRHYPSCNLLAVAFLTALWFIFVSLSKKKM